eukprot:781002_1
MAAEAITALKGFDGHDDGDPWKNVRYGYIEFDRDGATVVTSLLKEEINKAPVSDEEMLDEFEMVQTRECGEGTDSETDLCEALQAAFDEFDAAGNVEADSFTPEREKKILIVSHNMDDGVCADGQSMCDKFAEEIRGGGENDHGVSVFMINIDVEAGTQGTYELCLVMGEEDRIDDIGTDSHLLYSKEGLNGGPSPNSLRDGVISMLQYELCQTVPTSNPTTDPTTNPTTPSPTTPSPTTPSPTTPSPTTPSPTTPSPTTPSPTTPSPTTPYCQAKQNMAAEAITALKGFDGHDDGDPWKNVRYGYIEFDRDGATVVTSLLKEEINKAPVSDEEMLDEFEMVQTRECGEGTDSETDLCEALQAAFDEFDAAGNVEADSFTPEREKKILIVSHNMDDGVCADGQSMCDKFAEEIRGGGENDHGVSVFMINIDVEAGTQGTYELCLVMGEEDRIDDIGTDSHLLYSKEGLNGGPSPNSLRDGVISMLQYELCQTVPTSNPTTDPTTNPTTPSPTITNDTFSNYAKSYDSKSYDTKSY